MFAYHSKETLSASVLTSTPKQALDRTQSGSLHFRAQGGWNVDYPDYGSLYTSSHRDSDM